MSFWQWSKTANSNATAATNINWSEGQAPSSVNDSAREMMADLAKWRDDISGSLLTTGTATAYVLATNQGFDTLAHMDKALLCVTFNLANGNSPTLAVDGLTAHSILAAPSPTPPFGVGTLLAGKPYFLVYNNTDLCFYLVGNP